MQAHGLEIILELFWHKHLHYKSIFISNKGHGNGPLNKSHNSKIKCRLRKWLVQRGIIPSDFIAWVPTIYSGTL